MISKAQSSMLAMLWAAWVAKPTSVQGMMLSEIPPVITGA